MQYEEISDSELISLIGESEDAKDLLFERFRYIIDIIIKKYIKMASNMGIEYNDLYQEALLGFVDAINNYREDEKAGLPRFITVCVERKLQVALIKAGRLKNKLFNESLSLEHTYEFSDTPLMNLLSDNNENNPLDKIVSKEAVSELVKEINTILSDKEKEVYELLVSGLNYQEIATLLGNNPKQIDNTIQRIKQKVKKILADKE